MGERGRGRGQGRGRGRGRQKPLRHDAYGLAVPNEVLPALDLHEDRLIQLRKKSACSIILHVGEPGFHELHLSGHPKACELAEHLIGELKKEKKITAAFKKFKITEKNEDGPGKPGGAMVPMHGNDGFPHDRRLPGDPPLPMGPPPEQDRGNAMGVGDATRPGLEGLLMEAVVTDLLRQLRSKGRPEERFGPRGAPPEDFGPREKRLGPRGPPPEERFGPRGPEEIFGPRGLPPEERFGPRGPEERFGPRGPPERFGPRGPEERFGPRGPEERFGPRGPEERFGPRGPEERFGPRGPEERFGPRGAPPEERFGPRVPEERFGPRGPPEERFGPRGPLPEERFGPRGPRPGERFGPRDGPRDSRDGPRDAPPRPPMREPLDRRDRRSPGRFGPPRSDEGRFNGRFDGRGGRFEGGLRERDRFRPY